MKVSKDVKRLQLSCKLVASAVVLHQVASASPAFANGHHFQNGHARGGIDGIRDGARGQRANQLRGSRFNNHFGLGLNSLPISKQNLVVPTPIQLNLNSDVNSIVLSQTMIRRGQNVTIDVGGSSTTFSAGDNVSAGEYIAIQQAQSRSGQTIQLDAQGRATGGSFSLDRVAGNRNGISVNDIVIPQNVNATDVIGAKANINLAGDLINYGSITEISKGGRTSANLSAQNISNLEGALISSVSKKGVVDLNLDAANNITNLGTIESSGSLEISGAHVNNTGSLTAADDLTVNSSSLANTGSITAANVNLNGGGTFNVTNNGGNINALESITVNYDGTNAANIIGGNLLSQELNLNAGNGTVNVDVGELTGRVSSSGTAVHVKSDTDELIIGKQCLTGDPTYFNNGNIAITGTVQVSERLAIIASGNITVSTGVALSTTDLSGQGFDIHLIAGALITSGTTSTTTITTTPPVTGNATTDVTFSGPSATGGNITFGKSCSVISASTVGTKNAGNITLAAFGVGATGNISFGTSSVIDASSAGGTNGDVTIVAPNTVLIDKTTANKISVFNSQPTLTSGTSMTFDTFGIITSGNQITGNLGALTNGTITTATGSTYVATDSIAISGGTILLSTTGTLATTKSINIAAKGNISIGSDLISRTGISLISGRDINALSGITLNTTPLTVGSGGNITIVAGANFTDDGTNVTISGGSGTGGAIGMSALNIIQTNATGSTGSGGDLTVAAFLGTDNTGTINLGNAKISVNGGSVTGNLGDVTMVAGATAGKDLDLNNASITGTGNASSTGQISIVTSTPNTTVPVKVSRASGGITAGDFLGGPVLSGDIIIGPITYSGNVLLQGGGNLAMIHSTTNVKDYVAIAGSGIQLSGTSVESLSANSTSLVAGNSIGIGLDIIAPGGLSIISGHDITTTTTSIDLRTDSTGDAGAISIVAGALFTATTNSVNITGPSVTGGKIQFVTNPLVSLSANSTGAVGDGGSINLVAFTGLDFSGFIAVAPDIEAKGKGLAANGQLNAVGGSTSGNAINLSNVDVSGGTIVSGSINLQAGKPGNATVTIGSGAGVVTAGSFLPSSVNNANVTTKNLTAPLSVTARGDIVDIGTIDVRSANDGGSVVIQTIGTTPLTIGSFSGNRIVAIKANANATGDGGSVDISTNSDIDIAAGAIDVSVTNGNGGNLSLSAGPHNIDLPFDTLSLSGVGTNHAGGNLFIGAESITYANFASKPLSLSANGTGTASGGILQINLTGTKGVSIGNAAGDFKLFAQGGGDGGIVAFSANNATLTVDGTGIDVESAGANGNGGIIDLSAQSVVAFNAGTQPLVLHANGKGTANGGRVTVFTGGNATVGTAPGSFNFSATGGGSGGNGGEVDVLAGGDLTVDPAGIKVAPLSTGNGGIIQLRAGLNKSGILKVNGSLNVDGSVGKVGGEVQLASNSTTPFIIGGKKVVNGITGTISALGTPNGKISIENNGGQLTQSIDLLNFSSIILESGGTGSVVLTKSVGSASTNSVLIIANGTSGDITSKKTISGLLVQLDNETPNGVIGGKKAIKVSAPAVTAVGGGQVNVLDVLTSGPVDLNGGSSSKSSFTFTAASNLIRVNGPVSAATTATIASTSKAGGSIILNDSVTATNAGGTVNIKASGTGTITNSAGAFQAKATNVNLSSGSGAIGATTPDELRVFTDNLTALTTGDVRIDNLGTNVLNLNGGSSQGKFILHSANSGINVNASLKSATDIDFTTNGATSADDITINASQGGKNTNSILLVANGPGSIAQASSKIKLTSSANIDMLSLTGDIGSNAVRMNAIAPVVSFNTGGTGGVHASLGFKGQTIVLDSSAGSGGFDVLSGTGGMLVNDITADSILLTSTGGLLQTGKASDLNAISSITLNNTSTKGVIQLGQDSVMTTTGLVGTGEIKIVVGSLPPPEVVGSPPASNVTENKPNGGQIYYNNGITANAPNNPLTADGTKLIFSAPTAAQIILDGNVSITADPPTPIASLAYAGDNLNSPIATSVGVSHTAIGSSDPLTSVSQVDALGPQFDPPNNDAPVISLFATENAVGTLISSSQHVSSHSSMNDTPTMFPGAWASETELVSGEIPSTVIGEHVSIGDASGCPKQLDRGSILISSASDTTIETKFGIVNVHANSLALVMSFNNGLAVYNLDDTHRDAVAIEVGGKKITLVPGRGAVIAPDSVRSFDDINPAQLFAYRHVSEHALGNGLKVYRAEVSLPSMINAVQSVRSLLASKHPHAVRLSKHLLKTTSIMLQLQGSGTAFKQILKPQMAAMSPRSSR